MEGKGKNGRGRRTAPDGDGQQPGVVERGAHRAAEDFVEVSDGVLGGQIAVVQRAADTPSTL